MQPASLVPEAGAAGTALDVLRPKVNLQPDVAYQDGLCESHLSGNTRNSCSQSDRMSIA